MEKKALAVIDLQNDITKNYHEIIGSVNRAVDWAVGCGIPVVYIKHHNLSAGTRTFKPDTPGAELVPELKLVSEHIFTKTKGNALTCQAFADFLAGQGIRELYLAGADATACVKSTCFNLRRENYGVTVLRDCITSYDKRKIDEMLRYYESKGCTLLTVAELPGAAPADSCR